jgi:predicted RNase H-like nuclease
VQLCFVGIIIGMRVLGIDACALGWIGIELRDGEFAAAHTADRLTRLLTTVDDIHTDDIHTVGIDMPLGLVETGWRQADLAAQEFVGARRRSVFRMPPRAVWKADVWYEDSWEQANQRCRQLTGHGLSRQTWGLRDKLREADQADQATGQHSLHEVHPEVSFAAMNGRPLEHRKISWTGQMTRRALLVRHGIQLPDQLGLAGEAGTDDVLDAAAAAWSAHRIATGHAGRLPTEASPGQEDISIQY